MYGAFGGGTGPVQANDHFTARRRHRHSAGGDGLLQGGEPGVVAHPRPQQAPALALGVVEARDPAGVGRIEREHQTVQKPPPAAAALGEQTVHLRRQPGDR